MYRESPCAKRVVLSCDLCHVSVGVTSNTYNNRKDTLITVTPTPTCILLLTGPQELFANPV